jgi:hypothetical protein
VFVFFCKLCTTYISFVEDCSDDQQWLWMHWRLATHHNNWFSFLGESQLSFSLSCLFKWGLQVMSQLLCLPLHPGPMNIFHSLLMNEYVLAMHELESHIFNTFSLLEPLCPCQVAGWKRLQHLCFIQTCLRGKEIPFYSIPMEFGTIILLWALCCIPPCCVHCCHLSILEC